MVYGRDVILIIQPSVDWKIVKKRKQDLINKNNKRENRKRIKYTYTLREKVLIASDPLNRAKYDEEYLGLFVVVRVKNNGTIKYRDGVVHNMVNIRRVYPYKE